MFIELIIARISGNWKFLYIPAENALRKIRRALSVWNY